MRSLTSLVRQSDLAARTYQLTDLLHEGRTVHVSADGIVTVSAWLAELGAHSPLVEDLARTVCADDWTTAHAIADRLCVNVAASEPLRLP
jgi:hypothetical protein